MNPKPLLFLALSLALPLASHASESTETPTLTPTPVPALSAKAKAEITSLRKMKNSIRAAIKTKKLKERTQKAGDEVDWSREGHLYTDSQGRVRAYFVDMGNGDMSVDNDYFYDLQGNLRVVDHHYGNASVGTQNQLLFLDEKGAFLRVYVTGEVNDFSNSGGEDDTVRTVKVKEERMEPKEGPYTDHVDLVKDPLKDFAQLAVPEKRK